MDIVFEPLHISSTVMFNGTEEEKEYAQQIEDASIQFLIEMIDTEDFKAIEFYDTFGERKCQRVLHRSLRKGVKYQLSYFGYDGIAEMHENYGKISDDCVDEKIYSLQHLAFCLYHHFSGESAFILTFMD